MRVLAMRVLAMRAWFGYTVTHLHSAAQRELP